MKPLIWVSLMFMSFVDLSHAENRNVVLLVPSMNCPICPITLRKALEKQVGVRQVAFDYPAKLVTIDFDDSKTDPSTLSKATGEAGYPSEIIDRALP